MKISGFVVLSWILHPAFVLGDDASVDVLADSIEEKHNQSTDYQVVGGLIEDIMTADYEEEQDASCLPNEQEDVSGEMKIVETSADGKHVYGISGDNSVYFRAGRSGSWKKQGYKMHQISTNGDGSVVVGVYKARMYHIKGTKLTEIGYPYIYVDVSPDGKNIWGISTTKGVYHKDGVSGRWERKKGTLKQISVTEDGGEAWGVDDKDKIYYRASLGAEWESRIGSLSHISVSADGMHIWGVNFNDIVFYRHGPKDHFAELKGERANYISVSGKGEDVWSVDRNKAVHYRTAFPGVWTQDKSPLEQGEKTNDKHLKKGFVSISVSGNGKNIYGVTTYGPIYSSPGVRKDWSVVDGLATYITANEDGSELWAVNDKNQVFRRRVSEDAHFTKIMGSYQYIAASADGEHIYAISMSYQVWYRPGWNGNFGKFDRPDLTFRNISVNRDGSLLWGARPNDHVYYKKGDGAWTKVEGSMTQVVVTPDGEYVWGVNADGEVFFRNGIKGDWIKSPGQSLTQLAVADDMFVVGIDSEGNTYFLDCPHADAQ